MRALAERLEMPLYQLQSVASFYPHFYLKPPARVEVRVCGDMACHRHGAGALGDAQARLRGAGRERPARLVPRALRPGARDRDRRPDIRAGHRSPCQRVDPGPRSPGTAPDAPDDGQARIGCRIKCDPYPADARYGVLRSFVASRDWPGLIARLKESGLRGLGGAGFPTGMKWELVRNQPGPDKYVRLQRRRERARARSRTASS